MVKLQEKTPAKAATKLKKPRSTSRHAANVALIEGWAKGSPHGHRSTKHSDPYSLVLTQRCPFRPDEADGGFGLRVWKDGRVDCDCLHSKCKEAEHSFADLEAAMGSPCPVCQDPAEVLAKLALENFHCFYAIDEDTRYGYVGDKYMPLAREAMKTALLPVLKAKARELGFKLDDKGFALILREIQSLTQIAIKNRDPQWWPGSPVVDSSAWADANNVMVVGNGLLNPVAYAMGEPYFHAGRTWELFHRYASDVTYDPAFTHIPNWHKYLRDLCFTDDEIRNLQEALAFAVFRGFGGQYVILIEGVGGGGKSVFLLTSLGLCGTYGISREIDQALRGFGQADMQGKSLLGVPEAENEDHRTIAKFVLLIKRFSGQDRNSVDVKNSDFIELTHPPTPVLNSNNILAHMRDSQGSLLRRLWILFFHHKIESPDPNFFDKLKPEMPGILNWALEGFKRLYARGHFDLPESSQAALQSFAESSSPLQAFVDDHIRVDKSSSVSSDALYKFYLAWHEEGDRVGQKSFPGELCKVVPGTRPPRRIKRPVGHQRLPLESQKVEILKVIEGIRVVGLPELPPPIEGLPEAAQSIHTEPETPHE